MYAFCDHFRPLYIDHVSFEPSLSFILNKIGLCKKNFLQLDLSQEQVLHSMLAVQ